MNDHQTLEEMEAELEGCRRRYGALMRETFSGKGRSTATIKAESNELLRDMDVLDEMIAAAKEKDTT